MTLLLIASVVALFTGELQRTIDRASEQGGGRVVVQGRHHVGQLYLRSNVTLEIAEDAELIGSCRAEDYDVRADVKDINGDVALGLFQAVGATNVAIVGKGVLNGNGGAFPLGEENPELPRPRLLLFTDCRDVKVEGVTLRDSATWVCWFQRCFNVIVRGVTIRSQANHNNDGIDIEARGVLVENCDIDTLDDGICFKSDSPDFIVGDAEVRNCRIASCSSAIKWGTPSHGTYRNFNIHDCVIAAPVASPILDWSKPGRWWWKPVPGVTDRVSSVSGLSLENVDGGVFENCTIRNLSMSGVHTAFYIRQAARHAALPGRKSVMRNVVLENIYAETVSSMANSITGIPGVRPSDIVLRNVELVCKGGGTIADANTPMPEKESEYPENRNFDMKAMPAWGVYLRHTDNVTFENVTLRLAGSDAREPLVVDDCTGVSRIGLAIKTVDGMPRHFVDPLIGCAWNGHTYPGPVWPFGMVQPGPDSGNGDWQHCSGYVHADPTIYGFSQNHLSGTGCADLGDIRLLPFAGQRPEHFVGYKDVALEHAEAGYYQVALTNLGVMAEVTAGRRVAVHRWTNMGKGPLSAFVDFQWGLIVTNGDCPTSITNHIVAFDADLGKDCRTIVGTFVHEGWLKRKVHFVLEFDTPWSRCERIPELPDERGHRYLLTFGGGRGAQVVTHVALSETSVEAAWRNLESEKEHSFDEMRRRCAAEWDRYLGRFAVPGATKAQKVNFYTALYHLSVQPNLISDVGEEDRYTGFSLWDTFRAAHPLYTMYVPELVPAFVNSMLRRYRKQGFLPVIEFGGAESHCMIGNHAVPVVVDAVLKRFPGIDRALAYEAVTNSLTVNHVEASGKPKRKENWDIYERYGYYPYDLIPGESVSRTLECAYDDACAAKFAAFVGDEKGRAFFARCAENWRNVLDLSIGLVRGKDSKGVWREPFDPYRFGGGGEWQPYDCTEGNAFQYTWHVFQDPLGLIAALGGDEAFGRRLDAIFMKSVKLSGAATIADTTGFIGQYVHGNEPSHHIAFFYPFVGRPDRTAEIVREVCDRFYLPTTDGLCGNDDCGQMSAWYVFAALGFYPFDPCGGEFVLGAPQLPEVALSLPGGKTLQTVAQGLSQTNKYVRRVTFDGCSVEGFKVRYADLIKGGKLVFEMKGVTL